MKTKKLQEDDEYDYELQLCGPIKFNFEDDLMHCRANAISFEHIFPYRYCCCKNLQSTYKNKLTNDYFELGKDAVYITKKNLMLNHLLEITDTTTTKAVSDSTNSRFHRRVNESVVNDGNMCIAKLQENTRSIYLTSSQFLDKRAVSLFRSVALYWFFCLNTVFAKSNDGVKRRALPYDFASNSLSSSDFCSNKLNLSISPAILDDLENVNEDFFWEVISNFALFENEENSEAGSILLSFDENSRRRLYSELLKKMLTYVFHRLCRFIEHAEDLMNSHVSSSPLLAEEKERTDEQMDSVTDWIRYRNYFETRFDLGSEINVRICDDDVCSEEIQEGRGPCNVVDKIGVFSYCEGEELLDDSASENESSISFSTQLTEYDSDVEGWASDDEKSEYEAKSDDTITYTLVTEENYYFLPEDLFVAEEIDYPQYNIWHSPLFVGFLSQPMTVCNNVPKLENKLETDSYKTYSLWQSSTVVDDEQIPNFYFGKELSMFSIPYSPSVAHQAGAPESTYSLWGSPNIIDCLSDIGCKQQAKESWTNDNFSPDLSNLELMGKSFNETDWQFNDYFLGRSKVRNFRPVMNRFVSFTDRGAFKYYKKSAPQVQCPLQKVKKSPTRLYGYPTPIFVEAKPIIVPVEGEQQTSQSNEPSEETLVYELNPDHFFKPIQPAFRVVTDVPAVMERSASGTYYVKTKKYRPFRHNLDHQRDHIDFQPKYEINSNNKACQTEDTMYLNRWNFDIIYEDRMSLCGPLSFQMMHNGQASYNTAFFYTLKEVFNVFDKADMGNLGLTSSLPEFGSLF